MKKISLIAVSLLLLLLMLAACGGGPQNGVTPANDDVVDDDVVDTPTDEVTTPELIIFDFSMGSPDTNLREEEFVYDGSVGVDDVIDAMSEISGLDFIVEIFQEVDGYRVDWKEDSTLIANLDDRELHEDFFFYDADSMRWFMMDSLWRTLMKYFETEQIYYSMNDGEDLTFEELYPVNIFPADAPYMGSAFYFAHDDVVGDLWYVDEEYGYTLYYPNTFTPEPIYDGDEDMMIFEAQNGTDTAMQYWVIPNDGETAEAFAQGFFGVEGIIHDNKAVVGWDNATESYMSIAFYYLVDDDWIACVNILCESEDEASDWCADMLYNDVLFIQRSEAPGEQVGKAGISEEKAMDILGKSLNMAEGTALVSYGEETVNGVHCWTFAYGKNSQDNFVAEIHYAVTDSGEILVYDIASNSYIKS